MILLSQPIPFPTIIFKNEWFQVFSLTLYFLSVVSMSLGPYVFKQREVNAKKLEETIDENNIIKEDLEKCVIAMQRGIIVCKQTIKATHIFSAEATKDTIIRYFQGLFIEIHQSLLSTLKELGKKVSDLEITED
ncbi:MAG: hypothetical protein F6K17_17555 [Okeania sp. SIO3C4]|nr:hypothetical protein [Okeania sp. SIO3C4]